MKITSFDRGHIKVRDGYRSVTIEGEMLFFDSGTKIGFTLYLYTIDHWETPTGRMPVRIEDRENIVRFLREEVGDRYLDLVFTPA